MRSSQRCITPLHLPVRRTAALGRASATLDEEDEQAGLLEQEDME